MITSFRRTVVVSVLILVILISTTGIAQNKPSSVVQVPLGTQTVAPVPGLYGASIPVNYVRSWQPQHPFTTEIAVTGNTSADQVSMITQYVDGLGRPLQTVGWQASPTKKDLIQPVVYDAFGREQLQYLPYASTTNTGLIDMNPFNNQKTFYNTTYITEQPAYKNEQFYYGKTDFEASPLNRPKGTYAPGNSWVGSNKGTGVEYLINNSNDQVKLWTITSNALNYTSTNSNATINIPASTSNYNAGELYKTVTKDEHGSAVAEYEDKEGKVVLKKVQIGTIATDYSGTSGWLCTYYVYDDLGQLRFVIPPKAVATLSTLGLNETVVNELCFRYEYDERQRMYAKKVPGAGWVYMVYDKRDRLVFTQDANMFGKSSKQWMYTLYDELNRPIQTGIMTYTSTWEALRTYVAGLATTSAPTTVSGTGVSATLADLYIPGRESGRAKYEATLSIEFLDGFESEGTADFIAEIIPPASTAFSSTQTVTANPLSAGTAYPLTLTFYDTYTSTSKTYSITNNSKLDNITGVANHPEALPTAASTRVKGMVTVSRVRVLEDPTNLAVGKWMETAMFYDDKGRAVQVQSDNYKGGADVLTSRYDFTGKVINTYQVHNNASGNTTNLRVKTALTYDHGGRLIKVTKQVNDDPATLRTIVQNTYDALGQLKNKKIGQKVSGSGELENQDYAYNIRGWLKGINWNYPGTAATTSKVAITADKWFGMDLSYDWGFENSGTAKNQFNGNIGGMRWQSAGDGTGSSGEERSYGFDYDKANRLLKGDFTRRIGSSTTWTSDNIINFSMLMGNSGADDGSAYDENGNIKKMQQHGMKFTSTGVSSSLIDNMTYGYTNPAEPVSNKLKTVTEDVAIGSTDFKLGDFTDKNTTGDDYTYDSNGNLTQDKNKDIGLITYYHLNLPYKITVTGKGTITYIYDAAGTKLEKTTDETASALNNNQAKKTQTSYVSGFVYESNILKFFGQEEGRIRKKTATNFAYDYFLKDHLGNVRMVLTDEVQQDVYPAATLEGNITQQGIPNAINIEKDYYTINTNDVADKSLALNIPDYQNNNGNPPYNNNPSSNVTALSQKVYKLNSATSKKGLDFAVKVMSGDRIDIFGKSYFKLNGANASGGTSLIVSELINAFAGTSAVVSSGKATASELLASPSTTTPLNSWLSSQPSGTATLPKAFINWVLFDEQFKFVKAGVSRVGTDGILKDHYPELQNIHINKSGYLYVYCSNESPVNVFFDNLQVIHTKGALLEETHYYPFGLTMAGINSSAAKGNSYSPNRKQFNGIEHTTDFDLNQYDAFFRSMDPQIGRWWQIDPRPNVSITPYAMMENNPIFNIDPLGDTIILPEALRNNPAALAAAELFKKSDTFKEMYGQFDIGGEGSFFGGEAGGQSANTNVVFDVYSNAQEGGHTTVEIQGKNGNWNTVSENGKVDPSTIDRDSKARITLQVDVNTHKTTAGFANTFNHEANAHATPFLKTLNVLRTQGGAAFTAENSRSNSGSYASRGKGINTYGYNISHVQHGRVGVGDNNEYNRVRKELRQQMSPTQQKNYDKVVRDNLNSYQQNIPAYRFFVPQ